jgi:hypothetical protein
VPLEGKIEDLDEPEELQASVNPVPTKVDVRQTPTSIPESILEEDTEGVLHPVPPVAEDVQRTRKNTDAITMPRENLEMAESTRDAEEEDQAMAEWLSDPEDDEDVGEEDWPTATTTKEVAIQIGNVPVEGERGDFDERVNNEGNQPIPQPATKPEPEEKLPLAQPEEQGECRGKAASGEKGEGVDEVDWGIVTVDEHPKGVEPAQEYYSNAVWEFPEPPDEKTRRRKVNLGMEGRRKVKPAPMERREVNSKVEDDAKSNPHTPKFASRPMDLENTLLESQRPPTTANIAKNKQLTISRGHWTPHTHPETERNRDRRDNPQISRGTSPNFLG